MALPILVAPLEISTNFVRNCSNKQKLKSKYFQKICDEMNLQIRGIHGEHSESEGGVFDISNKARLGLSEYEAVRQMYDGVKTLIEMEKRGGK